jgi:hypothetical protein
MVGTYKTKTIRQSIQWATDAVNNGKIQVISTEALCCTTSNFAEASSKLRKFITGVSKDLGHFHATFYAVPETELVYHLKLPDCQLFVMTCNKVRQLVYQRGEIIFFTDSVRREEWLDEIS